MASELKNPCQAPNSTLTIGQLMRSKLGGIVQKVIMSHVTSMEPFLPQIGNGDVQQWNLAQEMLTIIIQDSELKLQRGHKIVQSILDNWSLLERHAEYYHFKGNLKMLVDDLIRIDSALVASNRHVKDWVRKTLVHPSTTLMLAREVVQLLTLFARRRPSIIVNIRNYYSDGWFISLSDSNRTRFWSI